MLAQLVHRRALGVRTLGLELFLLEGREVLLTESIVVRLAAHLRHGLLRELALVDRGHHSLLLVLEAGHTRAQSNLRLAHLGRRLRALDLHQVRENKLLDVDPHRVQLVHGRALLGGHGLWLAVILFLRLTLDEELGIVSFLKIHLLRNDGRWGRAIVAHLHPLLQVLVVQEDWRLVFAWGAAGEFFLHEGAVLGDHAFLLVL